MAHTQPLQVLAHFQRLQEDIANNGNNGPCGALRGVSVQEKLVGAEIHPELYDIGARDDIDTVVVVGRLADLLRILSGQRSLESSSLHRGYYSPRFEIGADVSCSNTIGAHAASSKQAFS